MEGRQRLLALMARSSKFLSSKKLQDYWYLKSLTFFNLTLHYFPFALRLNQTCVDSS